MGRKMVQVEAIPITALTTGGAVASKTGSWLDVGSAKSSLSLILHLSAGTSTSLTVTYEIGYIPEGKEIVPVRSLKDDALSPIQEMTPDDDGVVTEMTTVDLATSLVRIHDVLTLPPIKWIRFKCTCVNNTGTVQLFALFQI